MARWESFVWPRWLPVQARLPLIAQITGAFALIAAITMPQWSEVPPVAKEPPRPVSAPASPAPAPPPRPAHLNLDVRHRFANADLSVTVDNARVLETTLAGSGKKFGVFGKRGERGFTKTLDLAAGARVVRIRIRSAADRFDQTRVERFDLEPASVASMRIAADQSGLTVVAERPPAAPPAKATAPPEPPPAPTAGQVAREASALAELYQSLRSVLIALAGFIASAATGFLVQEFMRSRKPLIFAEAGAGAGAAAPPVAPRGERRRRKRGNKTPQVPDIPADAAR